MADHDALDAADKILNMHHATTITMGHVTNGGPSVELVERRLFDDLFEKSKILARTFTMPFTTPDAFLDRLKREYAELCIKIDALTLFVQRGAPKASSDQRLLLESQLAAMNLYRRTLDLRLQNLALEPTPIVEKPHVASEDEIGEPREIGGHDEDRDGPVKFEG